MSEYIGKTIAARLKSLNEGQAWLAERVGVSVNAVSKWTKTGKIARENVAVVAKALGLTVDELIGGAAVPQVAAPGESKLERLDPRESQLLSYFRECRADEQEILLSHAKLLVGSRPTSQAHLTDTNRAFGISAGKIRR